MISRQAVRLLSRAIRGGGGAAAAAPATGPTMPSQMVGAAAAAAASTLASSTLLTATSGTTVSPVHTMNLIQVPLQTVSSCRRWMSSTTQGQGEKKEEEGAGAGAGGTAEGKEESETAEAEPSSCPSKEEQLEAEVKKLKDQLLRSYAEQENTRNIAKRDVQEARQFAIKSFAKSLLEVSDNLQRALESVPSQELESNPQLQSLFQGIDMTNTGLLKALQANGVEKYCEIPGDKFDPSLHNALMQYPDPDKEPDTVGQVIKVGYTLNNRVLRPAEVAVVKKP